MTRRQRLFDFLAFNAILLASCLAGAWTIRALVALHDPSADEPGILWLAYALAAAGAAIGTWWAALRLLDRLINPRRKA